MEGARGDEPQIERLRRRRDHKERVLHAHEEQQTHCEQTRHPMELRHVRHVLRRPRHKRRPLFLLFLYKHVPSNANAAAVSPGTGSSVPFVERA